ncbi:transmembrane protein 184C [Heterostelium album PN500]|uniref:Transmembrane protein 184C n=1 Tax=Heterostelium pallidum (strain ATCC 26659 / Pp 5 / PN500) TaxID=670386 RepID=D3B3I5_HETP5|nr:transmembrane protein 184C [Heterostelium album PN500]EFA83883.1 transmembrane protein 184C [Heterostelium album PN500]|eukprot:XP_020436000.1 transmembrane protein 184C [Heterostelium album PN500]
MILNIKTLTRIESTIWAVAGTCSLLATFLSFYLIYKHLRNYTCGDLQKYIIRILIMVPVYAVDSWLSLRFVDLSLYFDLIRDVYEGYVLYCFFCLIVAYVERDFDVIELLHTKEPLAHPFPLGYCLPKIRLGRSFLKTCKRFVLQFVFVKPIIALISIVLQATHNYGEGQFVPTKGYFWLTIFENISVTLSLYFLVLYYQAMREELKPFKPFGKFMCIKAVIFFAFWQGIIISFLTYIDVITPVGDWTVDNISSALQDFITCVEMLIIAVLHHFFFSYKEFRDPNKQPFLYNSQTKTFFNNPASSIIPVIKNFFTVTSASDIIEDTKESFILPLIRSDDDILHIKEEERVLLKNEELNSMVLVK